jgi:hypothetical protein
VNALTQNWTLLPDNWPALRAQWEYSHAINAAMILVAFALALAAALRTAWRAGGKPPVMR